MNTGNSPIQPFTDILSSPFNADDAVLLDVFVRLEGGVAFENEVNVFAGVTFGVLSAADFIWPTHPAAMQPVTTRKSSTMVFMGSSLLCSKGYSKIYHRVSVIGKFIRIMEQLVINPLLREL
jgi:hypothetical protein